MIRWDIVLFCIVRAQTEVEPFIRYRSKLQIFKFLQRELLIALYNSEQYLCQSVLLRNMQPEGFS